MIALWAALFVTGQIPDLPSARLRILFGCTGELVTAGVLILGGVGELAPSPGLGVVALYCHCHPWLLDAEEATAGGWDIHIGCQCCACYLMISLPVFDAIMSDG
jgi:hypothetical protein